MIQAIYRSNFVLMGLPIAANIFGKDKLGMTAVLVAVVVPIYNMLAVITLEIFRGQKINVLKILKGIATVNCTEDAFFELLIFKVLL